MLVPEFDVTARRVDGEKPVFVSVLTTSRPENSPDSIDTTLAASTARDIRAAVCRHLVDRRVHVLGSDSTGVSAPGLEHRTVSPMIISAQHFFL